MPAVYRVSTLDSKVDSSEGLTKIVNKSALDGQLYVVATPIGNLADISYRAIDVLKSVDCILAEDTRHSKRLLNHYGVSNVLKSCHEHNESAMVDWVVEQLSTGKNIALISDAGTPLISDPGFVLVRALRAKGFLISTVPGASSIIAALSVAGLPTDCFVYGGFLASKSGARRAEYAQYRHERRTVVLLESSHRIVASVDDLIAELGSDRMVVIARELTKKFETIFGGHAEQVAAMLAADQDQTRGEFVLMLAGAPEVSNDQAELENLLSLLLEELSVKQAAKIAARITGRRKNDVYDIALKLRVSTPDEPC